MSRQNRRHFLKLAGIAPLLAVPALEAVARTTPPGFPKFNFDMPYDEFVHVDGLGYLIVARYEDAVLVNGDEFLGDWEYQDGQTERKVGKVLNDLGDSEVVMYHEDPSRTDRATMVLQTKKPRLFVKRFREGWCYVKKENAVALLDGDTFKVNKYWGPMKLRVAQLKWEGDQIPQQYDKGGWRELPMTVADRSRMSHFDCEAAMDEKVAGVLSDKAQYC